MTTRTFIAVLPLSLALGAAYGQTAEAPLSFEVASVKKSVEPPAKDDYTAGYNAGVRAALAARGLRISGQRVNVTDTSLRDLIRLAYQVKDHQISGPAWMAEEKFEIAATMPPGTDGSQAPQMLRTLLEQRFHLKLHRETRPLTVYALVEANGGAKLKAASATRGSPGIVSDGRLRAFVCSLGALADLLTKAAGVTVIDETGIVGQYDFDFSYAPESGAAVSEIAPTLSGALLQLGLRLDKRKMAVEVLVIEQADRVPTEN
jgi:uncharacterized protein (TIGR03435 family)